MPLIYRELRQLAHQQLRKERPGHTLQTSDLIHEAYFKLVNQNRVRWQNRAHFYGIASQLMRRILVDRARSRNRVKRGRGVRFVPLNQAFTKPGSVIDILELNDALEKLAEFDPRKARIVELRFFGGLEVEETAKFLNLSETTVTREWRMARAWLHKELIGDT